MGISGSGTIQRPARAALYCRCSTPDQRVDLQLDALRDLARQRGWKVANEYIDHGWSGANTKRPGLTDLMRAVGRGEVDIVCVWRLDRLGRSTRDLLNLVEELRLRNVQLVSAQENLDTTSPMGKAFVTLVALLGESEAEWLRDRTRAGIEAARRRGAQIGRPRVDFSIARARELMAGGQSLRKAARTLGIGASTLSRALRAPAPFEAAIVGRAAVPNTGALAADDAA
jgi:DNA invertase Pin-like site-specific DNA recombinase